MQIARPESKQPIPKTAKRVFTGVIFEIYQWEQKQFDGRVKIFEKAKRKSDSVNVLPITADNKIILTKQEQPGERPFIGAIGGRMDPGETPLQTAKREMLEESGYKANRFELLRAVHPEIKVDWVIYTFLAKDIQQTKQPEPDEGEKISLFEVSFEEYLEIVMQNNYRDSELKHFFLEAIHNEGELEKIRERFISS